MEEIRLRAELAIGENRSFIAHQVIADVHCLYGNGIGGVIAGDLTIDVGLNGSEKSIFVRRVHFEIKKGGQEKSVEKHEEVEAPGYLTDDVEEASKRHRLFLLV